MFDIGPGELIALAVLAMIVLGPEKLPRYAAEAARFLRRMRVMASAAREDVRRELGPEFDDLRLSDLNPRSMVRRHLLEPVDLDSLDDDLRSGGSRNGSRERSRASGSDKPAARRGPGDPPAAGGAAAPPPYDPDAT